MVWFVLVLWFRWRGTVATTIYCCSAASTEGGLPQCHASSCNHLQQIRLYSDRIPHKLKKGTRSGHVGSFSSLPHKNLLQGAYHVPQPHQSGNFVTIVRSGCHTAGFLLEAHCRCSLFLHFLKALSPFTVITDEHPEPSVVLVSMLLSKDRNCFRQNLLPMMQFLIWKPANPFNH